MIRKKMQDPIQEYHELLFKCAIFFSAGIPGDHRAASQGQFRLLDPSVDGKII
jgi:hypothetical protein